MEQNTGIPLEETDSNTTIGQLRDNVREFVSDRNWEQFHQPKNLAMSIAIEAAELMEHFQWLANEDAKSIRLDASRLTKIGEEIADVLSYLMAMANALDIDLSRALTDKMKKNCRKYPVDRFRGFYGPSDPNLPEDTNS